VAISATQLFEELKASRTFLEDALKKYKDQIDQLSEDDALNLAESIVVEDKVFQYSQILGYIFKKTASVDSRYFDLLKQVFLKRHFGLTDYLFEIGLTNPEIGIRIHEKAKQLDDLGLVLVSRWIFGGVGAKDFNLIYGTLVKDIASTKRELRIASITATMIAFSKGIKEEWREKVFALLTAVQDDEERTVREELIRAYTTLYTYDKEPSFSGILDICNKDPQFCFQASTLLFHPEIEKNHYLEMMNFLARIGDPSALDHILIFFHKSPIETDKKLEIIYDLIKRFSYYGLRMLDFALNEIGKVDLETSLNYCFSWLQDSDPKISYYLPSIFAELSESNYERLIQKLVLLPIDDKTKRFLFETSRQLLEKIYDRSSQGKTPSPLDSNAISHLLEKLRDMARAEGLNSEVIANRETLAIYKCLILVEVMETASPNIDYAIIEHNINLFPQIKEFVGDRWLKEKQQEANKTHPLLVYLNDQLIDKEKLGEKIAELQKLQGTAKRFQEWQIQDSMRIRCLLDHLENNISKIGKRTHLRAMKALLRKEEHFWKVFSEIDVRSRLEDNFSLTVAPPLEVQDGEMTRVKNPDFGIMFEGRQVFIEVISPEMFAPLRYFHNASIPNRVRAKITEEIKEHFQGMKSEGDVIIIVDLASSEIRYDSIQDYVEGELQYVFTMDAKTRDPGGVFTQRGKTMTSVDPGTEIIIGIIGYSRVMGRDGKMHLKGRKFPNMAASDRSTVLDVVTRSLLG
jgi:hypothetical protein